MTTQVKLTPKRLTISILSFREVLIFQSKCSGRIKIAVSVYILYEQITTSILTLSGDGEVESQWGEVDEP